LPKAKCRFFAVFHWPTSRWSIVPKNPHWRWLRCWLQPVIGFDTESKPTFRKGEVSTGPHLVQLATDAHVFLFPVACAVNHPVLREILGRGR
jgi:hypothetical protein